MLAWEYTGGRPFPVYVQRKYDGVRMLSSGVEGWSRSGKVFPQEAVGHLMVGLPEGVLLDGEVMLPLGRYGLQHTVPAVRWACPLSRELGYWVYDVVLPDRGATYEERLAVLEGLAPLFPAGVRLAPTEVARSEGEVAGAMGRYVGEGYEGAIVRDPGGRYVEGRSVGLLKLKPFEDEEFEVVGWAVADGAHEGCIIFECRRAGGKDVFRVVPNWSLEERRAAMVGPERWLGAELTVTYQGRTEGGIPRCVRGVAVRDRGVQG